MKILILLLTSVIVAAGCARVLVQAPKEPIRVDISMRLDIYQHIEKDIDEIENIVSGSSEKPQSKASPNILNFFVKEAYADEGLSPQVEQAALRRRDRRSQLFSWEEKGVVGENKVGLAEVRILDQVNDATQKLIEAENSDRMLIYQAVAVKNGTSVEEVQKLYAKRLHADSPSGTPIEVFNEANGSYEWKIKP